MLFLQPMPMDDVAAANRPVAAEVSVMEGRAHAAPAWNGMRLAQAPAGSPTGPAFDPNLGTELQQPGGTVPDVNPPRPNAADTSNGRSPFNGSGTGADPGRTTTDPIVPAPPATPDAAAPGTPAPTTTPPQPIDDTKAPGVPDQSPLPGTAGTSGTPLTPPSQTPTPNTADPGAGTASPPAAAPSATTPVPGATSAPAPSTSTPPPTDMGASGTR